MITYLKYYRESSKGVKGFAFHKAQRSYLPFAGRGKDYD